nr:hypothetical protein [Tanacetum cinerariifolium]
MVVFLSKSDASAGFDQIVDFLNAHVIQYDLMVNTTIYVSCIKQLWATVSIKNTNDVIKLQALINKKKVVVTEDVIRQDLRLDDDDGVECLPNEEIFAELARMGYEKPPPKLTFYKAFFFAHCLMASAVICLATETCATLSQKVNQLEQDKIDQVLEIFKLNKRVKKLENKRRSKSSGLKWLRKVGTSQRVESSTETVVGAQEDASKQGGRLSTAKEVSAAELTVFDDEEVTMTMAQTIIKMKAKKARLLDEQMAKRLHDEEVKQDAAREKQEKDDLEKAKVLQKQEYNKVQTLFKPDKDVEEPTKKRVAEKTPLQESFKKLKAVEVSAYQSFEDMLKDFDKEDLDALWRLVKEKFSTTVPTVDKEKALWVELTRLFEPNADDVFWKLQRYIDEDFHGGQQTKEQKFGYILQVIKKLKLKKLDGLLVEVDVVQRLEEKALRD